MTEVHKWKIKHILIRHSYNPALTENWHEYPPGKLNRLLKYFGLKSSDSIRHVTPGSVVPCACSVRRNL